MGILRTDKISGLETPTAVTGSVSFDGTDDALIIADHGDTFDFLNSNFTVECWIYPRGGGSSNFGGIWTKGQPYQLWWKEDTERVEVYASSNGSTYDILNAVNSGNGSVPANQWSHIAHTREGDTFRIFVNGTLTSSATSSATIFANTNAARISDYDPDTGTYELDGEISNLRVLKGTALYTADFTPPTRALEVINDTIILCCNNPDSVTASAFAGIGTAYAITTAGNPTVATRDPGLTKDFTYGTEFKGVTTFDTQGYFVPPSGTTEQRGRGRGIFGGAYLTPQGANASIEYIETSSSGNGLDFGDMSSTAMMSTALADSTRSVLAGGYSAPATINTIEFITIATTSNTTNFGDLSESKRHLASCASSTKGVWSGGTTTGSTNCVTTLDNVTIQSLGNAVDYGDLSAARRSHGGVSSPTRGVFAGGNTNTPSPNLGMQTIDYFTIASGGTALSFGSLTVGTREIGGSSDSTRAVFGGGYQVPANAITNTVEFVTIATTGNAQDFGDLTVARAYANGLSNSIKGIFSGGAISPVYSNTIDYVTIQSTGNANDFGDLIQQRLGYANAACDSHGGIS